MKVSAVLAIRALASKIHPPLPLTPRESQQLLLLLTSSFREQLNREHPSFHADDVGETTESPVAGSHGKSIGRRSSSRTSSLARASSSGFTDDHFQSILKNPLFSAGMKDRYEPPSGIHRTHHRDSAHDQLDSFDPVAWFEASVASGSANIAKATYAMDTLQKILTSSPETSIRTGMAASLAGSKIFSWLRSSGLQGSLDFPKDGEFIALLTKYLLAEKRHDVILHWIYTLHAQSRHLWLENSADYPSAPIKFAQGLLLQLVKSELTLGNGMRAAVDYFVRVTEDQNRKVKERQSERPDVDWRLLSSLLGPTGKYLVQKLTQEGGARQLDPKDLDRFTQNLQIWVRDVEFCTAKLDLHHPVKPSAAAALAYLKHIAKQRIDVESSKKRRAIVHLSLDCASVLLQQDLCSDATWVMEFIRRTYGRELGSLRGCQTDRTPSVYDEISNLELLASLEAR